MDFNFTEEQRMIIDGAKKFAEKELAPLAAECDEKQETNVGRPQDARRARLPRA